MERRRPAKDEPLLLAEWQQASAGDSVGQYEQVYIKQEAVDGSQEELVVEVKWEGEEALASADSGGAGSGARPGPLKEDKATDTSAIGTASVTIDQSLWGPVRCRCGALVRAGSPCPHCGIDRSGGGSSSPPPSAATSAARCRFNCIACRAARRGAPPYPPTRPDGHPYECALCGRGLRCLTLAVDHLRAAHAARQPPTCLACGTAFIYESELSYHMRRLINRTPFACRACGALFPSKAARDEHVRARVRGAPGAGCPQPRAAQQPCGPLTAFSCPRCRRQFASRREADVHVASGHNCQKGQGQPQTQPQPQPLTQQAATATTTTVLVTAAPVAPVPVPAPAPAPPPQTLQAVAEPCPSPSPSAGGGKKGRGEGRGSGAGRGAARERTFSCDFCVREFPDRDTAQQHIVATHAWQELPYSCRFCPRTFPTARTRNQHMSMTHKLMVPPPAQQGKVQAAGTGASETAAAAVSAAAAGSAGTVPVPLLLLQPFLVLQQPAPATAQQMGK